MEELKARVLARREIAQRRYNDYYKSAASTAAPSEDDDVCSVASSECPTNTGWGKHGQGRVEKNVAIPPGRKASEWKQKR